MKWNDNATTVHDGRAQPDDKTFYKWLNSYGWEVINWQYYTGYGARIWTSDDITYNIRLDPFYIASSGYYVGTDGQGYGGYFDYWSNTPGTSTMRNRAGYLGYDGALVAPAWYNTYRRNAFSLRCLTQ